MPSKIKSPQQKRLERLLASYERKIRNGFRDKIDEARRAVRIPELAALIEAGSIEEALAVALIIPQEINALALAAFLAAAEQTSKEIFAAIGVDVQFDDAQENAERIMANRAFQVTSQFTQKQEDAVREVLIEGIRRGRNPRQQAIALRDSIGLTANQVKAVNNFRKLLETGSKEVLTRKLRDRRFDRTINRGIREAKRLEQERIDRMVTRYRERYIKYRAETIARTEALSAIHQGKEEMFNTAIAQGHLTASRLEGTWITKQDAARRHHHGTMQGQVQPHGVRFISGLGNLLLHPGDPNAPIKEIANCRCLKVTRII